MNRRSLIAIGAAACVVTGVATAYASAAPAAGSSAATTLKQVPGMLLGLSKAEKTGAAPAAQVLTLGIGISRPDIAGEQQLLTAMTTKGNPLYHQFMTPAQFESKFGVAASTVAATKAWLTSTGATIQTASATGDYFTVKATVAQAEKLLHVTESTYYDKADKQAFYANEAPALVPSTIPVSGVMGLDNVHTFKTADLTNPTAASAAAAYAKAVAASSKPAKTNDVGSPIFDQLLYPQDLWKLYDEPSSNMGQGETMGVFGEGETDSVIQNLRYFEQQMGLPKIPVRVTRTEPGADSDYGDTAGAIEWYLDTQAESGMAPDATRLDLYFAKTLFDADIAQDFSSWVTDPQGPTQMNASFGECEQDPANAVTGPLAQTPYGTELGDELEAVAEPILQEANLEGRTLFSSAGDTGSGCPEVVVPVAGAGNGLAVQPVPIVEYPSDSAFATGVGGTVLEKNDDGTRADERSWTFSGGGASHFIVEPSYQKVASQNDLPCVSDPNGSPAATGITCRGNPDVAALSGNATFGNGYYIVVEGAASSEGGTSLSSPLWVGMWTRIQAAAPAGKYTDGGLGPAMNALYSEYDGDGAGGAASPHYSKDFYDITASETGLGSVNAPTGGTVDAGTGNGAYQPTTGWDYASGLGSPNVANLMQDLDGKQTPTNPLAFVPADTTGFVYPEAASVQECTATENSPLGNATDPVVATTGNIPGADISKLTFTTSADGSTITAVVSGPDLGAPFAGVAGEIFEVVWTYNGVQYFASYDVEATGNTYSEGTLTYATAAGKQVAGKTVASPKGTAVLANNAITFTIPTSEVGSPAKGALLDIPMAFSQLNAQALNFTTDTATAGAYNTASVGQAVVVGDLCAASAGKPVVKTTPKKKTTTKKVTKKKTTTTSVSQGGTLAYTGLGAGIPIGAVALLVLAFVVARRRKA